MKTSRGLFVVLDGLIGERDVLRFGALAGALRDFRGMGYRIIGIMLDDELADSAEGLGFQFDELVCIEEQAEEGWEFPRFAWSMARRFSLNVRRSLLCSDNRSHSIWASGAGLQRFETPQSLFRM